MDPVLENGNVAKIAYRNFLYYGTEVILYYLADTCHNVM
jgi:hypothetical protein